MRNWLCAALIALALIAAAAPRETEHPMVLTVGALEIPEAAPGERVELTIPLSITRGYHVNANPPASEDYLPLEIVLPESLGVAVGNVVYPAGKRWRLEGGTEDLLVYDGRITVRVPLQIAADAPGGELVLAGRIEYQACDDHLCLMPDSRPLLVRVKIRERAPAK